MHLVLFLSAPIFERHNINQFLFFSKQHKNSGCKTFYRDKKILDLLPIFYVRTVRIGRYAFAMTRAPPCGVAWMQLDKVFLV